MRPCSAMIRSAAAAQSSGPGHVDAVEQVEPDDDVAGRGEAVDDGRADPAARSGHHHDPFRHRCAPLGALSNMRLR